MRKPACLLISALLVTGQTLAACSVFFAFDGKSALAGDNEDYFDHPLSQMWTVPRTENSFGAVYFGFGGGAYPVGGVALTARMRQAMAGLIPVSELTVEDAYGVPMQGMNEKGLFCGGAETEIVHDDWSHPGIPEFKGDVADLIVRHAASVPDALQLIGHYNYWLPEGNLLCADASGDSFILEAGGLCFGGPVAIKSPRISSSRSIRARRDLTKGTESSTVDWVRGRNSHSIWPGRWKLRSKAPLSTLCCST